MFYTEGFFETLTVKILTMKNLSSFFVILLLVGCQKDLVEMPVLAPDVPVIIDTTPVYTKYTIFKGQHYCDKTAVKSFSDKEMSFKVIFDSTAIYTTLDPVNQGDINKLVGFTEGIDNHINSARIGWGWNKNALRLYAYVYANSVRSFKEISTVAIGAVITCKIGISEKQYSFEVDDKKVALNRAIEGPAVAGYWQYPYFGGDEVAPGNIYIYMLDIKK